MKSFILLFSVLIASSAQARNYLCSDGTRIIRDSKATVIYVVIDGNRVRCEVTATTAGPETCSAQSDLQCPGQKVGWGDCTTPAHEFGKCIVDIVSPKVGRDGNPICGCGIGE